MPRTANPCQEASREPRFRQQEPPASDLLRPEPRRTEGRATGGPREAGQALAAPGGDKFIAAKTGFEAFIGFAGRNEPTAGKPGPAGAPVDDLHKGLSLETHYRREADTAKLKFEQAKEQVCADGTITKKERRDLNAAGREWQLAEKRVELHDARAQLDDARRLKGPGYGKVGHEVAAATNQVAQLQGQLTRMTEEHRQQSARDRTLDKLEASGPQPLKPGDFAPMYKGPGGLPEDGAPMYKGPGGLPEDGAPMYKGPGGSIPEARNLQLASAPTAKSTPIQKLKEELAVLRDMIQKSCYDGRITDRERDNIDQARISLAGKVNLELPKEAQAIARTKEKLLKARAAGNEKQALRLENQLRSQQSELDKKIDRTLRWIEKQK